MNRIKVEVVLLALLIGVFLGRSADSIARGNAYEFFDTLVDIRSELSRHYVEEPDQQKMMEGAIEGMLETLEDPHTSYFSPEVLKAFDKQTRASFSGIGAEITTENGMLTIVSPLEDSPAFNAGIQAGDVIMTINGDPTEGLTTQQAVEKITGPEGTDVVLKIRHLDGTENEITITRKRIQIQTVKGFARDAEHHWNFWLDKEAKIGYVRLTQFSDPTADALREAIEQLKKDGMKGVIIDLRFNPGGLLDQAIKISDMFVDEGRIVSTKGRTQPERVWDAEKDGTLGDFPLVILINEFSASASEIVSGALKDNGRAVIVGTRSFGKGSVQQVLGLHSGSGAVKLTTAHYYLPSGRNLHKRPGADVWGVDPSDGFYVPMNADQIRKMNEVRRESDIVRAENGKGDLPERVTPQWLREQRADLQLAAALEAMLGKINTGEYTKVGADNATLIAHVTERDMLEQQRKRGLEAMAKINEKLKELDDKIATLKGGEAADAGEKKPDAAAKAEQPKAEPAPAND